MCRGGFTTTYTTAGAVTVAAAMIHALTDLNLCGALRLQVDVPHKTGYLKNNTDVYSTISGNLHTQIHKKYFCQVH